MLRLGLSALLSASAMSLTLPKALKKELINVAFLDSLSNHVKSASSFRSIAFSKICGLYRVLGLGARISGDKCRKLYNNTLSRDNRDTKVAIYMIWKCLVLGL